MEQLEKLASMKDRGILTEAEFATQKAALLGASVIMAQPAGINQRPPPPGCPPGGKFMMVKYHGPVTQQAQQSHGTTCCIIGILCANPICCLLAGCPPQDLKDEKEVYQVGGTYYTLNGTVDTNVGPAGAGAGGGGKRGR